MTKKKNAKEITERPIELANIPLKEEDLLWPKSFINNMGGKKNARILLLDIIDRYFNSKFFDLGLLEELDIKFLNRTFEVKGQS